MDADYLVVTCTECLGSASIADDTASGELQQTDCLTCGSCLILMIANCTVVPSLPSRSGAPNRVTLSAPLDGHIHLGVST
jgi:hypothetical protein